jgi:transposase
MGADKDRPLVMTLDVVDTGRRRRWSDAEKLRIVSESMSGRRLVSATARRHGMSRSLLTKWRKLHGEGRLFGGEGAAPSFAPVIVSREPPFASPPSVGARPGSDAARIEIVLTNGRRIVIDAGVDAVALARVLSIVERA